MTTFKVATYNVNSLRSRIPLVLSWLKEHDPDVLCLQETKVPDDKFPRDVLAEAGYHALFRGRNQYNGVATLSKGAAADVSYGFDDGGPPDEDRLIIARFGTITVINTYVPQGRDANSDYFAYKLSWFARLKALFQRRFSPTDRLIWCGDLNVAREPIDVHDPKRLLGHVDFHPDVWQAFDDVLSLGSLTFSAISIPGKKASLRFMIIACRRQWNGIGAGGWIISWPPLHLSHS